ncbi:MAG: Mur ligase [Planctomycetota bacterium]|nr:MAG: Mur ligase [Planctomycetota bacterium]
MLEARRLTGPNMVFDGTGAVLEVELPTEGPPPPGAGARHGAWAENVRELVAALGMKKARPQVRRHDNGISLGMSATRDLLYTATEILEAAWQLAGGESGRRPHFDDCVEKLRTSLTKEARPELLKLEAEANRKSLPLLADDDFVSLGYGASSLTWPVDELPAVDDVPWEDLAEIPVALVTGTNGKTTTVRLLAAMLREAGFVTGTSSTDSVEVNGELIEKGDWSGPGGARTILRDTRVQAAVLETARGGLLRRGLNVPRATTAAVLNVAEDHFGEWGIHSLDDLADAKLLVSRAVPRERQLVLNADDPFVWERGARLSVPSLPFGLARDSVGIAACLDQNRDALWIDDGKIVGVFQSKPVELGKVSDVALGMGGAARHNLSNALAAASMALVMGLEPDAIRATLKNFASSVASNPGRSNLFEFGKLTALVDFAHNPHGLAAVVETCAALPAKKRAVVLGQAGDRDDAALHALADAVLPLEPDLVILKEMSEHARGREVGDVVELLAARLVEQGVAEKKIERAPTELDAVRRAFESAGDGDQLLLLTHAQRDEVFDFVASLEAAKWKPGDKLPK